MTALHSPLYVEPTPEVPDEPIDSELVYKGLFNPLDLERLWDLVQSHIDEGRYTGCQIAMAHEGEVLMVKNFGWSRLNSLDAQESLPVQDDTLFLLYSNTKMLIATLLWKLFEQGRLSFNDTVSTYLKDFGQHGKESITLFQLITHQAGFPNQEVPQDAWLDHDRVLKAVCDFHLEWTPGSKVSYHALSAHWVLAMVIEQITQMDFRQAVEEVVLKPLGLERDLYMGLPAKSSTVSQNVAYLYEPHSATFKPLESAASKNRALTCANLVQSMKLRAESHDTVWQTAAVPGGGAYGTAKGMALLYQMMVQGGVYKGVRFLSEKTLAYAIRNHTGDRVDLMMGMPMHRGLGPHLRGHSVHIRGLGTLSGPSVFGHGGVGTSYAWADPERKFSFAYITNTRLADPWHSKRLEMVSNHVQLAFKSTLK